MFDIGNQAGGSLITGQGRLSALPAFMRDQSIWRGCLSPEAYLDSQDFADVRHYTASHCWSISPPDQAPQTPSGATKTLIEIALALLQRGAWTTCSWSLEQHLAHQWRAAGLATLTELPHARGVLGFEFNLTNQGKKDLGVALICGLLPSESPEPAGTSLWDQVCSAVPHNQVGSPAEKAFFESVLVPVLGFPLLHYLRVQTPLSELIDRADRFVRQRVDFSIETGRGLRMVIEVDSGQFHQANSSQTYLDRQRTKALESSGWLVWRPMAADIFNSPQTVKARLQAHMQANKWGIDYSASAPRSLELMNAVWGATVAARIQFLLLTAWHRGLLPTDRPCRIAIDEDGTSMAQVALTDLHDWLGRLFSLYQVPSFSSVNIVPVEDESCDLLLSLSCRNPWHTPPATKTLVAHSCPVNQLLPEPTLQFSGSLYCPVPPSQEQITLFAQDLFRKPALRDGQLEILNRILTGKDVVGLLPTGGGKSLTYQLAALLLPGATLYVAPLKSLLQDQYERMIAEGVDACAFVSSALNTAQREQQESRFASGRLRMLMVAPERFLIQGFHALVDNYQGMHGSISQVVVDECHCVSEWGHEFRPAYLSLSRIIKERTTRLGSSAPIVALTGTASTDVLEDVCRELGVLGQGAVTRAKRLDRPELTLNFQPTPSLKKPAELAKLVEPLMAAGTGHSDGLLIFCPNVTGPIGVIDIYGTTARLCSLPEGDAIRFYSGAVPCRYENNRKVEYLPSWAARSGGTVKERWELTKSKTQRDFISGRPDSFRVLVATSAFGMGIDKPTIRHIIHYVSPMSPESYYQEVGRAARDGLPSTATLLFSDENSATTDRILDPGLDIEEAASISNEIYGRSQCDFLLTFWKMANAFAGIKVDAAHLLWAWREIARLHEHTRGMEIVLRYRNAFVPKGQPTPNDHESALEYALVRLMHLGVVDAYTKDYHKLNFGVTCSAQWLSARNHFLPYRDLLLTSFETYIRRYEARQVADLVAPLESANNIEELENVTAERIIYYLYEKIEKKRRRATRTMLEIARAGVLDPAKARRDLVLYLQASERFSERLILMAREDRFGRTLKEVTDLATSPAEWDELKGAAGSALASSPDHPGLLMLSAITRTSPSAFDLARSAEDFLAAINRLAKLDSDDGAADLAEMALNECETVDPTLAQRLTGDYAQWSHDKFGIRFALNKVSNYPAGQAKIMGLVLHSAQQEITNWMN